MSAYARSVELLPNYPSGAGRVTVSDASVMVLKAFCVTGETLPGPRVEQRAVEGIESATGAHKRAIREFPVLFLTYMTLFQEVKQRKRKETSLLLDQGLTSSNLSSGFRRITTFLSCPSRWRQTS